MIIVLEGIDNAGKSTLAKYIAHRIHWQVYPSEGPPKYRGEMNIRIHRYALLDNVIFDRHPVVSQSIYRSIRTGADAAGMDPSLVEDFYNRDPLFIYCDPGSRGMIGHTHNDGIDTEEHLEQVIEGYDHMLSLYRLWAIEHAHIIYRIGRVSMEFVANTIKHNLPGA